MTFHISPFVRTFVLLFSITFLLACSKNNEPAQESPKKITIQGAVEKGPFVRGSVVTIYELNSELNPTGRSFKSEILDDKGGFSLADIELASNYIQLSVNGYYFNELTGNLSSAQITLNAIADISGNKYINVNVLSHLEEKRVRSLIKKEKKTFNEAKKQALGEIFAAFFVKVPAITNSELVSLTKNDDNANILLGISAALLNIAQSNNAKLTELLSVISTDLDNDGSIDISLHQAIKQGLESLDAKSISDNMKNRYKALNTTLNDFTIDKVFSVELKGEPEVVIGDNFFKTEQEYLSALSGLLFEITKSNEEYFKLEGLYSKTVTALPQNPFYLHQVSSSQPNIYSLYANLYKSIYKANAIMDYAAKSATFKSFKYKSYPYYAYNYWVLMNFWGNVPLLTPEDYKNYKPNIAATGKKEISEALMAGLNETIQNLGRLDTEADFARIIAARIATDLGDYTTAKKYLTDLANSNRYKLASKSQIHISSNELISGINYDQTTTITRPNDYSLYGKGNYRHLARYTEALLLAVEVNIKLNNKAEAITLLKQVRERNGKTTDVVNENNVLQLLQEEIKEDLGNEGVYFAFLKRNNLAESTLGIQAFQKLLPIPQMEMMLNPAIVQNPGY